MKLRALLNVHNKKWAVRLHGVERSSIVEVRIQNTMTGRHIEQYIEADHEGMAVIDLPDFGQHYAITLRVLTANNSEVLHRMYFDATDSLTRLTMSSNPEHITNANATASNGTLQKEVITDV